MPNSSNRALPIIVIICIGLYLGYLILTQAPTSGLIVNTLLLMLAVCGVAVPVGTIIAGLLMRCDLPFRRTFLLGYGLMLPIPLYLQAAAWKAGFGVFGSVTMMFGTSLYLQGWFAAILIHAIAAIPWVILIVGIGLRLVKAEYEEQAMLLLPARRVFFRVTLRQAMPATVIATLWVAITTATQITVTDLFQVRTLSEVIYTELVLGATIGEIQWQMVPLYLLMLLLLLLGGRWLGKINPQQKFVSVARSPMFRLRGYKVWAFGLMLCLAAVIIGVPLLNLIYKTGEVIFQDDDGRHIAWSLSGWFSTLGNSLLDHATELRYSLLIGLIAACGSVLIATVLVWFSLSKRSVAMATLVVCLFLMITPGPLLGLMLIELFNHPSLSFLNYLYDDTISVVVLAQLLRTLPWATLVLWFALRSISADIQESATLAGATSWRRLWAIALPMRRSAVFFAWVLSLILAMGDLSASKLVSPPGVTTISTRIFGLIHSGVQNEVAAISLIFILTLLLFGTLLLMISREFFASKQ